MATGKILFQIQFIFHFIGWLQIASLAAWFLGPNSASPHIQLYTQTVIYLYEVSYINYSLGNFSICDFPTIHSFIQSMNIYEAPIMCQALFYQGLPNDTVVSKRGKLNKTNKQKNYALMQHTFLWYVDK